MSNKNLHRGQITQIIGPVLDVAFQPGQMPNIFNALCVQTTDKGRSSSEVICEVQQLLGDQCGGNVMLNTLRTLPLGLPFGEPANVESPSLTQKISNPNPKDNPFPLPCVKT